MTLEARTVLPAMASALCFVFAALLFRQWYARRRPYQLVWSLGMLWYALAAGADVVGQWAGWTPPTYRLWYLAGAIAAAAWLGLGEVYLIRSTTFGELVALALFAGAIPALVRGGGLLGAHEDAMAGAAITVGIAGIAAAGTLALVCWERPQWLGHTAGVLVGGGTLIAAWHILAAPVDASLMVDPDTGIPHGAALPETVRLLTPLFNIAGALALLFGAAYSAWAFWRQGASGERVISSGLIVAGAFAPSLGGSLNRFGMTDLFYWCELLGVLLIFAGFLVSSEVFSRRRPAAYSPSPAQGGVVAPPRTVSPPLPEAGTPGARSRAAGGGGRG
jgi:hypothetical protein